VKSGNLQWSIVLDFGKISGISSLLQGSLWIIFLCNVNFPLSPMEQQPLVGRGFLIFEASRSHSDTRHTVWLLWTSDQPDAETSTWQHTTHTRYRHPFPGRESNPQFLQESGRRPRPWTAWPLGSAYFANVYTTTHFSPSKCRTQP